MSTSSTLALRQNDYTRIEVIPLAGALGAEIAGVDLANMDDATFEEVHRAWLKHQVIYFRRTCRRTITSPMHAGGVKYTSTPSMPRWMAIRKFCNC